MSPEEDRDLRVFISGELGKVHRELGDLREEVAQLRGLPEEVAKLRGLPEEVAKLRGLPEEVAKLRTELGEVHVELEHFEGLVGRHFEATYGRLDSLDGQLTAERASREQMRSDLRKVAEGVVANGERIDRLRGEMHEEFASVRGEMKAGFDAMHERVARLEAS